MLSTHRSRQILLSHCKNLSAPFHNMSVFSFYHLRQMMPLFHPGFTLLSPSLLLRQMAHSSSSEPSCPLMFICFFDWWRKWNRSITTQPLHHCPQPGSLSSHPPISTISTLSPVSSQPFSTLGPKWSSSNTHSHPSSWRELPIAVRGHELKWGSSLCSLGPLPSRAHTSILSFSASR